MSYQIPAVYLAGPINGCTDAECKDCREYCKKKIKYNCIDPLTNTNDWRGKEKDFVKAIVEGDKAVIDRDATILLVNYNKETLIGTAMEILYAYDRKIPVYVVNSLNKEHLSPWLIYHAAKIYNNLDEAIDEINMILEQADKEMDELLESGVLI
jgi:nucleoside 2-deoxyribosyltransferase